MLGRPRPFRTGLTALLFAAVLIAPAAPATAATPSPPPPTRGGMCHVIPGWNCTFSRQFAAAYAYLAGLPGHPDIIVVDRVTGASWRAGQTTYLVWTESTIKLAMVIDLLERNRAGTIQLTTTDRNNIQAMLNWSSDSAADALWSKYGGTAMADRFRSRFGMTHLVLGSSYVYWGEYKCTDEDLLALDRYLLDKLNSTDRAYVVGQMKNTAAVQHWGVWDAGPANTPGNKNGWSYSYDPGGRHWVLRSVGFAGAGERYAVVVTDSTLVGATERSGVQAVSDLVALAFGAQYPAPITLPVASAVSPQDRPWMIAQDGLVRSAWAAGS